MLSLRKIIAAILAFCLIFSTLPISVVAESDSGGPSLSIQHTPVSKVEAGKIISISANLKDREGIELVRVYFRKVGSKPYFFVPMIVSKGDNYFGMLPAPLSIAGKVEYLFLVKTYNNRIFSSEKYTMAVPLPQTGSKTEKQEILDVMTETNELPLKIDGFDSRTRIRLVTKHEKHGVLAGLYSLDQSGGTSSNGRYHGTVATTNDTGMNPYWIAGGVAAGAIAIGLLAGSGGSGGSSSSSPPPAPTEEATGAGTWTLQYENDPCFKATSQTVECSAEGLVTAISPTAIGVPVPPECSNSPFNGLADIFLVGGSCDSVTACTNYTAIDLVSKSCENSSIVLTREGGSPVERWSK